MPAGERNAEASRALQHLREWFDTVRTESESMPSRYYSQRLWRTPADRLEEGLARMRAKKKEEEEKQKLLEGSILNYGNEEDKLLLFAASAWKNKFGDYFYGSVYNLLLEVMDPRGKKINRLTKEFKDITDDLSGYSFANGWSFIVGSAVVPIGENKIGHNYPQNKPALCIGGERNLQCLGMDGQIGNFMPHHRGYIRAATPEEVDKLVSFLYSMR